MDVATEEVYKLKYIRGPRQNKVLENTILNMEWNKVQREEWTGQEENQDGV